MKGFISSRFYYFIDYSRARYSCIWTFPLFADCRAKCADCKGKRERERKKRKLHDIARSEKAAAVVWMSIHPYTQQAASSNNNNAVPPFRTRNVGNEAYEQFIKWLKITFIIYSLFSSVPCKEEQQWKQLFYHSFLSLSLSLSLCIHNFSSFLTGIGRKVSAIEPYTSVNFLSILCVCKHVPHSPLLLLLKLIDIISAHRFNFLFPHPPHHDFYGFTREM
jgi:hypothetical protein